MFTNTKLAKSVKLACAFGAASAALFTANVAMAQDDAAAEPEVEKISVTGSRIKRTDIETSSPILAIDAQAIESTGFTRIEDVMNTLPQIEAAETSFSVNGATGVANLDLRGLGAERTLVLVNGRRLQPGGVYSQAPDVNQIPASLVKRVDVLTGGASTVYGSDAVAGVVNFIMDTDFTGLEIEGGAAGYQHDNDNAFMQGLMDDSGYDYPSGSNGIGGESYNLNITAGGDFDSGRGHITAYATWRRNTEMLQGERDYSSCALNTSATACGGSSTADVPNFIFYPVVGGEVDYTDEQWLSLLGDGGFAPLSETGNLYNYAPVNHFMRPNERFTLGSFAEYEINDKARVYVETSFMQDRTSGQIAESGTFYGAEYLFDYDNPIMSDAQKSQIQDLFGQTDADQFVTYIGKRNTEGGARSNSLEHNSFRIVTGVDGWINDTWSYDINYMYAGTSSSSAYQNDLSLPTIGPRVGEVGTECTDECLYYEVFTPNGVTAEMASQLSGTAILNGNTSLQVFQGYVAGEFDYALPSAVTPIGASFGFERRETDFERIADSIYQEGSLVGQGGSTPSLIGEFDVNDIFGELSIPVLEGMEGVEALVVDLGFRFSDYSTSGRANTYKVGVDWAVNDDWKVRASFNRAIRAPNISELFAVQNVGLFQGTDPCAGDEPALTAEQCAATGLATELYGNVSANPADQYNEFAGGNPELEPEEADTFTVGIVGSPYEGLNFSLDYFSIDMEKVIADVGAERIINICGTAGLFCDNIQRAGSGSLWLSQDAFVTNLSDNIGGRTLRGIDVDTRYSVETGGGTLGLSLIGSYNLEKTFKPVSDNSALDYDCSGVVSVDCFAQPEWRHTVSANYNVGDWSVIGRWRYYGEVDIEGTENQISAFNFFDLSGSYIFNEHLRISAGVNNVLDKEPPLVGSALATNANTVAGFYDTLGRYLFTTVTLTY
ncbi:TonB-dependent receptor [Salinimonas sediminis]|uniref:TonB-dependent receptor n=1 Tax=Salinimonas sediminis TaxID=2303538 RepID=A0A346NJW1_9ALTE|nr:TonB-dependent receptor [Salinimonas sediminis]AXR05818.1 TonB-dependent receptor [Salinimonas sediminis]